MVRERVKNRVFPDRFLVTPPPEQTAFPLAVFDVGAAPLEVDIGCGRGRFLLARAATHPDTNFLGIDRSLLRLRKLDRKAVASGIGNIRLVNTDALAILPRLPPASVSTFYLYFPDPWPKTRHHSRRLVSPVFIDLVFKALKPLGAIHLCTDHAGYYSVMCQLWGTDRRFTVVEPYQPSDAEETDFGLIFRGQDRAPNRCSYQKQAEGRIDDARQVD